MNRTSKLRTGQAPLSEGGELLRTKLTPPRLRGPLVERADLYARLDEALEQRVILLSAPAGAGKTTLVRAWLESRAERAKMPPVAWVSLDANDNDPGRFWRYVLTACQSLQPGLGSQSLEMLRRMQQSIETALTIFINELTQMAGRGILVLEDYHTITEPRVHETLSFLLDYLPETLHVVLITRVDPPLPLARWRVHRDLEELRAGDLRFSSQETRVFLQQAFPFPLAPETLVRLEERIEGWAAGLRLLTLAAQGRRDQHESEHLLATFSGSHQHILEYLVADVLNAQPRQLQDFLLQTSLLPRLSAPLCDALTGRQDSGQVLGQLDQANLFLYPLDASGQWYRYHALFAEAMQFEARQRLGEEAWNDLHRRASRWYEADGSHLEAVEMAILGRDFAYAADMMERLTNPQIFQREYYTLLRWADKLPEEHLQTRPGLCIIYATGLLYLTDRRSPAVPTLIEKPLRLAEQVWQAEGNRSGLGQIEALRSSALWWQADYTRSFDKARRSQELLPAEEALWRGSNLVTLGVAELFAGRPGKAREILIEARLANEIAGNFFAARAARFVLCQIYEQRGELRLAGQIYQQLFSEAEAAQDFPDVGAACLGLGKLAYEWNHQGDAREALEQCLDVARRFSDDENLVHATVFLARLNHFAGQSQQVQQDLTALSARMQRWPHLLHEMYACQALLALTSGDLVGAQQHIAAGTHFSNQAIFQHQETLARLQARLLIAQGQTDEALALLLTWQVETQERGFTRSLLEILVLQALAHHARKEMPQARQALLQALTLARPENYQRLFLDEGPLPGEILRSLLPDIREEHLQAWARSLLGAFNREYSASASSVAPGEPELIEPLSPQERRVLRLLAAGRSNPEIANELVVSINTIKTQVQSIYYKLGVNSRQEARDAARKLHLV
ncbi:MAG TPA: LuxR C-terminal-related transcriptional regulator [Ktedonobacteraceae bacterium]|nr:LuxR C-terminal-related transcriptional regulator [Ktedonobacteraceae bacterium]